MITKSNIAALPTPAPGHVRVIRVEPGDDDDELRATYTALRSATDDTVLDFSWALMPTPQTDFPAHDIAFTEVCAAHPHTFHEWFPAWVHSYFTAAGLRVVALDVPKDHAVVQEKQVVITRSAAVLVARLH